jgi:hypothetical protein
MFRLYYAPSTCALATHIALEEAGARYEAVPVDFGSQAQRSSEYLAINPKGRVSRAGDGKRHTHRNSRLLLFVAQRLPKAELTPLSDPFALAQLQEFNIYLARPCWSRTRMAGGSALGGRCRSDRAPQYRTRANRLLSHRLSSKPFLVRTSRSCS